MRLLIYLLAMMTGFSAAGAARPIAATPAAVAQHTVAAVSSISVEQKLASVASVQRLHLIVIALPAPIAAIPASGSSPVTRHDITRQ